MGPDGITGSGHGEKTSQLWPWHILVITDYNMFFLWDYTAYSAQMELEPLNCEPKSRLQNFRSNI